MKHLLYLLLGISFWLLATPVQADIKIEQHLSLTNQQFTATQSAQPTDNSLGLIYWDEAAYSDASVYFEAIIRCDSCTGGNAEATASLYTAAGNAVTDAAVSTANDVYTLIRTSSAVTANLTDDTEYTVRLSRDATAGTAYLIAARLIIIQSHATKLTTTQTQLELGSAGSTTNTSYMLPANPKMVYYDAAAYAPTPTITFEANLKSSDTNEIAAAALSASSTCATTVSGSSVSVTGTDWDRQRSSSFSLDSGTYYVCFSTSDNSATAFIANAKLILSQSHSGGISMVRTHLPTHTSPLSDSDDTYSTHGGRLSFNPDNWSGARFTFYYESILQTTGGTAFSRLYNTTDGSSITNAELSTTQTAFARITSSEITAYLPTTTKSLDTELKNSSTDTTTSSGSWLIAIMKAYPSLSFSISGVTSGTSTNGMTTSATSQAGELDFGSLVVSTPKYLAHQLSATTNAASGYIVSVKMVNTLQGMYPANIIEEFPATWNDPQAWTEPTGTTANVNTGWFGANTSDTRVSGWETASSLFGPVGTTNRTVMYSAGVDAGTTIYLTYVMEINRFQPTDSYAGSLVYSIVPTY